jgi:hypothetical protein
LQFSSEDALLSQFTFSVSSIQAFVHLIVPLINCLDEDDFEVILFLQNRVFNKSNRIPDSRRRYPSGSQCGPMNRPLSSVLRLL